MVISGVYPWRSIGAVDESVMLARLPVTPEHDIDVCMCCKHSAESCDRCDGRGNLRREATGRPRAQIDITLLRELMQAQRTNRQMCAALGVSNSTLARAKKQIAV